MFEYQASRMVKTQADPQRGRNSLYDLISNTKSIRYITNVCVSVG